MRRTTRRFGSVLATAIAVGIGLPASPAGAAPSITAHPVVPSLSFPTAFTFGPGNVIWYVQKAVGEIRQYDLGSDTDTSFVTVSRVNSDGERGMLGIALHPDYPTKPFVYVYVTRDVSGSARNQILRYTDSGGTGTNRTLIWSAPSSATNHNGGHIAFGPDGKLYVVVGDGGSPSNSQDRSGNDRGKVLRMNPNGGVPNDNPFANRIYSYGLRNSFGFAFDPETGRLWETENGPECNDELNRIIPGRNYGWGPHETCSGTAPRDTNQDGPHPVLPRRWYASTFAPTGAAFCEGCRLGRRSDGSLFFGAHNTGDIRRVRLDGKRKNVRRQKIVYTSANGILSIEVGPGGHLYYSDDTGIFRLARA